MNDQDSDLVLDFPDADETAAEPHPSPASVYLNGAFRPEEIIARLMLWKACGPQLKRDIAASRSILLIVETTKDWLDPIHSAVRKLVRSADYYLSQAGKSKSEKLERTSLKTTISIGRSLVVVASPDASNVHASILASADYCIRIAPPDREIIAQALRRVFSLRRTPKLPADLGPFTDPTRILGAIRPQESAARAIRRLIALHPKMAQTTSSSGPTLAELRGYGAAHDWGMDLARDIEAFRAGLIKWSSISSAAILYGAPGVGKTFFAEALAGTCRIPLITTSLGRIFADTSGHLGAVIRGLDEAFAEARTQAPSLLFLDELDSIPDRKTLEPRAREWWSSICNHLLKLLDDSRDQVVIVAATNLIERIDQAVLRPGRIDRHFEILLPDEAGLQSMFRLHLGTELPDADLAMVAHLAYGVSGAKVELYVKSARAQARREERALILEDLVQQIVPDAGDPAILRRIAIHECGHALAAHLLGREVDHVSTIRQDGRLGGAMIENVGRGPTRKRIEEQVIALLGGRNAEILLFGEPSSGSRADLDEATQFIAAMHGAYGLGDSLIHRAPPAETKILLLDPAFRTLVEAELQKLDAQCRELLEPHRERLRAIADELLEKRALSGERFIKLVTR